MKPAFAHVNAKNAAIGLINAFTKKHTQIVCNYVIFAYVKLRVCLNIYIYIYI